jgi:hypothetical protein
VHETPPFGMLPDDPNMPATTMARGFVSEAEARADAQRCLEHAHAHREAIGFAAFADREHLTVD